MAEALFGSGVHRTVLLGVGRARPDHSNHEDGRIARVAEFFMCLEVLLGELLDHLIHETGLPLGIELPPEIDLALDRHLIRDVVLAHRSLIVLEVVIRLRQRIVDLLLTGPIQRCILKNRPHLVDDRLVFLGELEARGEPRVRPGERRVDLDRL
jgi:hypothetical protein